jgi:hypothetical protein
MLAKLVNIELGYSQCGGATILYVRRNLGPDRITEYCARMSSTQVGFAIYDATPIQQHMEYIGCHVCDCRSFQGERHRW